MSCEPIVLDSIPFTVDAARLGELRGATVSEESVPGLGELIAEAQEKGSPRVVYRQAFIDEREETTTVIGGIRFASRVLAVNLAEAHRAFPFVATCGRELARWAAGIEDPLLAYWADAIMELAVGAAHEHLVGHLRETQGLTRAASMNPGSLEDWPLAEQVPLFQLLGDVEARVGVSLSPTSYLMSPTKSVSGIRFPTEVTFESCMLCPREKCPGRRAGYDPQLASTRYGI